MKKRKRSITIVLGLVALMILNLQAGNEKPASIIIQIEISKNGQVFIAEEPVKIGDIEQVAKDILKATPEAIFHISRSIETAQDVFLTVLDELKKADARKISVAVPTE